MWGIGAGGDNGKADSTQAMFQNNPWNHPREEPSWNSVPHSGDNVVKSPFEFSGVQKLQNSRQGAERASVIYRNWAEFTQPV